MEKFRGNYKKYGFLRIMTQRGGDEILRCAQDDTAGATARGSEHEILRCVRDGTAGAAARGSEHEILRFAQDDTTGQPGGQALPAWNRRPVFAGARIDAAKDC